MYYILLRSLMLTYENIATIIHLPICIARVGRTLLDKKKKFGFVYQIVLLVKFYLTANDDSGYLADIILAYLYRDTISFYLSGTIWRRILKNKILIFCLDHVLQPTNCSLLSAPSISNKIFQHAIRAILPIYYFPSSKPMV